MSLSRPHQILTSCGSNTFEVHKAMTTLKMLSGRYLTDMMQRHWTQNKAGFCRLPGCIPLQLPGTLEHILLFCPSLHEKRQGLLSLTARVAKEHPALQSILHKSQASTDPGDLMQLLLDCTVIPCVIGATQTFGSYIVNRLLYLGRTWCYNIHRERVTQLGLLQVR